MNVRFAESDRDIRRCFPVMAQLRPHLSEDEFIIRVKRQFQHQGYRLVYVEENGQVRAVAGFRIAEMLSRGRFLYVDDLVTAAKDRSRGYGSLLFEWLVEYALSHQCERLDLDSGVQRTDAHRFYIRRGMHISGFHFSLTLTRP